VNHDTDALVMTGSDDGSCRVWRGCFSPDGPGPRLATSWRAYPDLQPRLRSPGLVLDWQQVNGSLVAGGDGPTLMWWDVSRELCTQGVSTGTDSYVTSLAHNRLGGTGTFVGCGDGSVLVFDHRVPDGYGAVSRLDGHRSYIVGVRVPLSGRTVFTASVDEPVLMWDIRKTAVPVASIDWDGSTKKKKKKDRNTITSFAVHDYAPIVAVGSSQQFIKVYNMRGAKLSTIRYHDGFLGQRIGAVTCLNFHPTEVFLAAGGADSIISIYAGEGGRVRLG
jgi:regulator-associated protein of mTOR